MTGPARYIIAEKRPPAAAPLARGIKRAEAARDHPWTGVPHQDHTARPKFRWAKIEARLGPNG